MARVARPETGNQTSEARTTRSKRRETSGFFTTSLHRFWFLLQVQVRRPPSWPPNLAPNKGSHPLHQTPSLASNSSLTFITRGRRTMETKTNSSNAPENEVLFVLFSTLLGLFTVFYCMFSSSVLGRILAFIINTTTFFRLRKDQSIKLGLFFFTDPQSLSSSTGSIHFAFIIGRIYFQNFEMTTRNTSLRILDGCIWLRWWRKPVPIEVDTEGGGN